MGDVICTSRRKGLPQINKQFFFCFYEHFLHFCWDFLFFLSIISLFLSFSSFSPLFHIPPCFFPLLHFFHFPSFPLPISSFHTSFLFLYIFCFLPLVSLRLWPLVLFVFLMPSHFFHQNQYKIGFLRSILFYFQMPTGLWSLRKAV